MTIELLDWVMWIVIGLIMWFCFPEDWKEEMGCLLGGTIELLYTIIYASIFWFYSWADDIFPTIFSNWFHIKW